MKKETLSETAHEARRFLKAVDALATANDKFAAEDPQSRNYKHFDLKLARFTAAVRRSSLDLTKSLAKLRQEK